MLHARPAVGRGDPQFPRFRLQQSRHKSTLAAFQEAQDFDFALEALRGVRAVVRLEDAPIETDLDGGAERVFDL
jgi:hypothetical protein